ncbi:MAG: hypothetical protein KC503_18985 [Myxococcales bacterium]|nr:hypothetical protein [Myxococcales bacterium]
MSQADLDTIFRRLEQLDRQLEHTLRKAGLEPDLAKLLPILRSKLSPAAIDKAQRHLPTQPRAPRPTATVGHQLSEIPRHLHRYMRRA